MFNLVNSAFEILEMLLLLLLLLLLNIFNELVQKKNRAPPFECSFQFILRFRPCHCF